MYLTLQAQIRIRCILVVWWWMQTVQPGEHLMDELWPKFALSGKKKFPLCPHMHCVVVWTSTPIGSTKVWALHNLLKDNHAGHFDGWTEEIPFWEDKRSITPKETCNRMMQKKKMIAAILDHLSIQEVEFGTFFFFLDWLIHLHFYQLQGWLLIPYAIWY